MSAGDFALLEPTLSLAEFRDDAVIYEPGGEIRDVYFIETGVITVSEPRPGGARIGIAHIGFDGMAGWPVLLDSGRSSHEVRMTAFGGSALRIAAADLLAASARSPDLRNLLLRFVQAVFVQMARTITSSLTQSADARLCRWTLMAHDRVPGDRIMVTHEEIATMLAVRRATITDLLHLLEGEGLIRSERGVVHVVDRGGLKRRAGGTYGSYEAEYSRLIAPFPQAEAEE